MKVYGALEAAQIEWFTDAGKPAASSYPFRVIYVTDLKQIQVSDGTNWNPTSVKAYTTATLPAADSSNLNQLAFITDTLQVKISNGTIWKTIGARLDTYTSGTIPAAASNANSMIWVSDLQQVQISNGTSWVQVGSKAGAKNYFSQNNANPDFETNSVSPWSACTLTFSSGVPSGAPTLSATQMAISVSSSDPLAGTYSMLLTKSAANAQYQGVISGSLVIDREDTAKVLYGSFAYEVVSGTVDFSGTSTQTYEIWIYNTVSGQWTQPAGYRGMNQTSGVGKVVFSFQTDGTFANNTYKVAVITQQTGTSAAVVKFDDFQIGPAAIVTGAAITDWQSYTPTFTGLGTPTSVGFSYRRVGDSIEIQGKFTVGTSTATEARISLPSGLSIADTTKIPSLSKVGSFAASYIEAFQGDVLAEPSVTYLTLGKQGAGTPGLQKLNGNSVLATSGQICSLFAKVPVAGFSSNVQMSSDTDTRVVTSQVSKSGTQSIPAGTLTKVTGFTVNSDDCGLWDSTNNRFNINITGYYRISAIARVGSAQVSCSYRVNGVTSYAISGFNTILVSGSVKTLTKLNAGDYVELMVYTASLETLSASDTMFQIERLSGPSVIAATETVAASYYLSANFAATTSIPINFDVKELDSHGSVTTSSTAWKFTAPISGTYMATVTNIVGSVAMNTNIYKNGTLVKVLSYSLTTYNGGGSVLIRLNAGEYIDFRPSVNSTVVGGLSNGANTPYISILRVGN